MSTAKDQSKKIRRAVRQQAATVRQQVAVQIVTDLCALPFAQRLKWAVKIARGLRLSPWERLKLHFAGRRCDAKTNK